MSAFETTQFATAFACKVERIAADGRYLADISQTRAAALVSSVDIPFHILEPSRQFAVLLSIHATSMFDPICKLEGCAWIPNAFLLFFLSIDLLTAISVVVSFLLTGARSGKQASELGTMTQRCGWSYMYNCLTCLVVGPVYGADKNGL